MPTGLRQANLLACDNLIAVQTDECIDESDDIALGRKTMSDGPQGVAALRSDGARHLDTGRVVGLSSCSASGEESPEGERCEDNANGETTTPVDRLTGAHGP